ncbi:hypothetical protein Cgig2_027201 [Carnegiea gigantea]|uniref:RRM domain-containing protein n=1 Tax=Carnegiea gigantea TaxID=171969 RepID=A0A9Q1KUK8_9CARY|nr:hypothetical protein Cgig2_027201 [Carnegiea gigantea]
MTFCGGFGHRHQRWAAGKGPPFASRPPPDFRMSCFCPWCLFACISWHHAQPVAPHRPRHFPSSDGRRWRKPANFSGHWRGRLGVVEDGLVMSQAKHYNSGESRGNQMQIFSLFIDNLPIDLDNLGLEKLFSSYGEIVDVYIPSKVGRKSGRKYGFIRFGEFYHGKSAIEALNGKIVNGHKLEVACPKFHKRPASKPRKQREEPQKKMLASPHKQALLRNLNGNKLAAPNGNLEVVGNDAHEGLSDNIPFSSANCGSFMEDDEDVNSTSLRPFDRTLEMDIQLHEKREKAKYSNKGKKSGNRNSRPIHNSPAPTKIAKEALEIGKRLGISVVGYETLDAAPVFLLVV